MNNLELSLALRQHNGKVKANTAHGNFIITEQDRIFPNAVYTNLGETIPLISIVSCSPITNDSETNTDSSNSQFFNEFTGHFEDAPVATQKKDQVDTNSKEYQQGLQAAYDLLLSEGKDSKDIDIDPRIKLQKILESSK